MVIDPHNRMFILMATAMPLLAGNLVFATVGQERKPPVLGLFRLRCAMATAAIAAMAAIPKDSLFVRFFQARTCLKLVQDTHTHLLERHRHRL